LAGIDLSARGLTAPKGTPRPQPRTALVHHKHVMMVFPDRLFADYPAGPGAAWLPEGELHYSYSDRRQTHASLV